MATKTDVTIPQVGELREMANAKGVSRARFQKWLVEEAGKVLEGLKSLLAFTTSIKLEAIEKFVASEHFTINTSANARVKIGWMSDDFKRLFLGKVENNISASTLKIHRLERGLLDKDIRAELGPECEEITLAQFYQMLTRQGHGQSGALLTNGYANIAYIRDINGKLWAVSTYWHAGGGDWYVFADSVACPGGWGAGRQVLSR